MNFLTLIAIMVRIWALTIFVWTARWIVFPWLNMYPYIPPVYINVGLWRAFCMAILIFTAFTFAILLILWIIYLVLNFAAKKVPLPMKIVRRIVFRQPPFKQLIQTGMFRLLDALVKFMVTWDFKFLLRELIHFWKRNMVLLMGDLGKISASLQSLDDAENPRPSPEEDTEPYQTSDQREIDNQYQICLEQNTQPLYPGDNSTEIARKKLENRTGLIQCQADKLRAGLSIFHFS